ncbi:MAG TPA: hypothetical protein VEP90_11855 [Methylomirabilota bacterium]|nr:hypothetical protein [Methylomirabilota bacterium]
MENEDTIREVQKLYDALTAASVYLDSKDQMNAALHMSTEIRSTPLASAVRNARANATNLMSRLAGNGISEVSP